MNGTDIINLISGFKSLKDITNNYVSDLSPLTNCNSLTYVRCGDNSYTGLPDLNENVYVDEREEEDFSHR